MVNASANLLFAAFILYLVATVFFGGSIKQKKGSNQQEKPNNWAKIGIVITIIGFVAQLGYFILRWIAGGHAPVSNLFEFTTFFGMALVGAFIVIYFVYKTPLLGLFTLPVALLLIAYASMFSREITPLIPSLQSNWLHIHVTTAALGQAILAISFAAGVIYLVKSVDQSKRSKSTFWLEVVLYGMVSTVGFVVVSSVFGVLDYEASFTWVDKNDAPAEITYEIPALTGPHKGELVTKDAFEPLVEMPAIINAKKLNTVIWSLGVGLILYGLIRLILRNEFLLLCSR